MFDPQKAERSVVRLLPTLYVFYLDSFNRLGIHPEKQERQKTDTK